MPIILFIDEAHTLIGAGGAAGQSDAANLLKPALARGELRTIAATTWAEYKKYFESDAALKRRFQVVKVDEPDEAQGRPHDARPRRRCWRSTTRCASSTRRSSTRCGSRTATSPDRQLPDKAVSLLDTACARVALSQSATPPAVDETNRELRPPRRRRSRSSSARAAWPAATRERVADLKSRTDVAEARKSRARRAARRRRRSSSRRSARSATAIEKTGADAPRRRTSSALAELNELAGKVQGENPLVHPVVDGGAVAEVVSGLDRHPGRQDGPRRDRRRS